MYLKLIGSVLLIVVLTSFSDQQHSVIGSWKIAESHQEKTAVKLISVTRKDNPKLADQLEENFLSTLELVNSVVYKYNEDQTYEIITPYETQKGKWELKNNGRSLWVAPENRQGRLDSIMEFSQTSLLIINKERGDTVLYTRLK